MEGGLDLAGWLGGGQGARGQALGLEGRRLDGGCRSGSVLGWGGVGWSVHGQALG